MSEKKISLVTDAEGLDAALLHFFTTNAAKADVEREKLEQEKRTLAAKEEYFIAQTKLAVCELKMFDDPETAALRKANIKLRARLDNRALQRELSSLGRDPKQQGEWKKGAKPVHPRQVGKRPEEKPLTHHMEMPVQEAPAQEKQEVAAS